MGACRALDERCEKSYAYEVIQSEAMVEEVGRVVTFGIRIYNRTPYLAKRKGEYSEIQDISTDIQQVLALKEQLEELEVSPVHLRDIVEDFLS